MGKRECTVAQSKLAADRADTFQRLGELLLKTQIRIRRMIDTVPADRKPHRKQFPDLLRGQMRLELFEIGAEVTTHELRNLFHQMLATVIDRSKAGLNVFRNNALTLQRQHDLLRWSGLARSIKMIN